MKKFHERVYKGIVDVVPFFNWRYIKEFGWMDDGCLDKKDKDDIVCWLEWAGKVRDRLRDLGGNEDELIVQNIVAGATATLSKKNDIRKGYGAIMNLAGDTITKVERAKERRDKACMMQQVNTIEAAVKEELKKRESGIKEDTVKGKNVTITPQEEQDKNETCQAMKCLTQGAVNLLLEGAFSVFGNPIKVTRDGTEWVRNFLKEQADTLL